MFVRVCILFPFLIYNHFISLSTVYYLFYLLLLLKLCIEIVLQPIGTNMTVSVTKQAIKWISVKILN